MSIIADYLQGDWPQSPVEIPNVGRDDLARYFAEAGYNRGVEIGTQRGLYAEVLCAANPNLHLTCVDPYLAYRDYREHKTQSKIDEFHDEARRRLAPYNADFIRLFSSAAVVNFRNHSLDFVYIDGNHALMYVIEDLCLWAPKVRRGGIIAGHDFIRRADPSYGMHVVPAVYAYTDSYSIHPWFILGSKRVREGEVRDRPRSFMWVKQ